MKLDPVFSFANAALLLQVTFAQDPTADEGDHYGTDSYGGDGGHGGCKPTTVIKYETKTETIKHPVTVTAPCHDKTVNIPAPGHDKTITVTAPGHDKTVTITAPGHDKTVTITAPGHDKAVTVTAPGEDKYKTITVTAPGEDKYKTVTVTAPGEDKYKTITVTAPREDKHKTITVTGPGEDKYKTVTVTQKGDDKPWLDCTALPPPPPKHETVTVTTTVTKDGDNKPWLDCTALPLPPPPPPHSPTPPDDPTTTGLVVCPSRIVNPTYIPPTPLPTNYHWGCPAGKICTPPQKDCNFEANPPAESYFCRPENCKPVPEIPAYINDTSLYANPTDKDCAWYKVGPRFFNLNPEFFGLTYAIFSIYGQPLCDSMHTDWADWTDNAKPWKTKSVRRGTNNPLALLRARQATTQRAANECYAVYNTLSYVGQALGLSDRLCAADGDWQLALSNAKACLEDYPNATAVEEFDEFVPYLEYCKAQS